MSKIGFIGQGWIGKNYADDFEERGLDVVRYSKEPEYINNKEAIKECEIVFIAVPTPTTSKGFDCSIVRAVLPSLVPGTIAVIKSTLLPGTTVQLQKEFPNIYVFHSPEFLTEANAADDARAPLRNIIGIPEMTTNAIAAAYKVLYVLPDAPHNKVVFSNVAELVKYSGNCLLYTKVIFVNLLYNLAQEYGVDWETFVSLLRVEPRLGNSHWSAVHDGGRGAGGDCFIKDFYALMNFYADTCPDDFLGIDVFATLQAKNLDLLESTGKSLDLLKGCELI